MIADQKTIDYLLLSTFTGYNIHMQDMEMQRVYDQPAFVFGPLFPRH